MAPDAAVAKAEADVRGFLKTYRDPKGPQTVSVDLSDARWDDAWAFVERVQNLAQRLQAEAE